MGLIQSIFETIGQAITSFAGVIGNGFNGVISLFWDDTAGSLTTLGVLGLIGVGVGLVYWAFRLVRGLMSTRSN